ncbi:MAG TPA: PDZ domain-containing protein, partial [Myxococcales bacterium]|nr:PDZ domain-containing protein [Myxococcales bacterium]
MAGLRSGDLVVAVAEETIEDWDGLLTAHAEAARRARERGGEFVTWHVERASSAPGEVGSAASAAPGSIEESSREEIEFSVLAIDGFQRLGLMPATILVAEVSPDRPAALAGLQRDDLILEVDGEPIGSFQSFVSLIQTSAGRELSITYSRSGRVENTKLRAREETVTGPYDIEGMAEVLHRALGMEGWGTPWAVRGWGTPWAARGWGTPW